MLSQVFEPCERAARDSGPQTSPLRVIPGSVASSQLPFPFFHRKAVAAVSLGWPAPSPYTVVAGQRPQRKISQELEVCLCFRSKLTVVPGG